MSEERRRYFRIDDALEICYRRMAAEEAKAYIQQAKQQGGEFDLVANFDNRIQTLLDACKIQSPLAAELADLINKKLNFVIQQMDVNSELIHKVAYTLKTVNISACGMAFESDDEFSKGQILQLDILLHPSELHLVAIAEVIDCSVNNVEASQEKPAASYFVRLNFTEMNNHDQELLIQHIVKRQSLILKQRRHQLNEND